MGYASYYENINDRIADLNHRVLGPTLEGVAPIADSVRTERAEAVVAEARIIEKRLCNLRDELLELATDPDVQLAFQLAEARRRLKQLGDRLAIRESTTEEQVREIKRLREELTSERRRSQVAERGRQQAERELETLVSEDRTAMARLLDRYAPATVRA